VRKRRVYAGLLVIGVVAGGLGWAIFRSREPAYGGRALSQWVSGYSYEVDRGRFTPGERERAIRAIGTNALPFLLQWLRYETPPWKSKLYGTVNPALRRVKPSWEFSDRGAEVRADGAVFALIALCGVADGAVGELSKMANDPAASPAARLRAVNVLNCIEPRSWKDRLMQERVREAQ